MNEEEKACLVCAEPAKNECYYCYRPLCETHTWYVKTALTPEYRKGRATCETCYNKYQDRNAY